MDGPELKNRSDTADFIVLFLNYEAYVIYLIPLPKPNKYYTGVAKQPNQLSRRDDSRIKSTRENIQNRAKHLSALGGDHPHKIHGCKPNGWLYDIN